MNRGSGTRHGTNGDSTKQTRTFLSFHGQRTTTCRSTSAEKLSPLLLADTERLLVPRGHVIVCPRTSAAAAAPRKRRDRASIRIGETKLRRGERGARCGRAIRLSSHGDSLLVQQVAPGTPDFHSPVSTIHGLAAVGAIALGCIGADRQLHRLSQRVSLIPTMEDDRVAWGTETCKEDERSGHH